MTTTDSKFQIIRPVMTTDATFVSATVAEADYTAWNIGTAYAIGNRVIVTTPDVHKIYEVLIAHTGQNPVNEPVNMDGLPYWAEVGPTNRWAMLDLSGGTETVATTSMEYVFTPGRISTLVLLRMRNVINVRVRMSNAFYGDFYDETFDLPEARPPTSMFEYVFDDHVLVNYLVVNDLPLVSDATLTLTITGGTGVEIGVGTCVMGKKRVVGGASFGAEPRIIDYSEKTTNAFGRTTFVERDFTNGLSVQVLVEGGPRQVDAVLDILAEYRARPAVYLGAGNVYASMIVLGVYRDARMVVQFAQLAYLNFTLDGLT